MMSVMAITKKHSTANSLDVGIRTRQVVGDHGCLTGFVGPKSLSINPKTVFAICVLNFLQVRQTQLLYPFWTISKEPETNTEQI